jgi:hypothetical protein
MSYSSRVYRQRNPHAHDEANQEPFFSKQPVINSSGKKNAFFQAKLTVNEPGDKYEHEADSAANAVMTRRIQQMSSDPEKEKLKGIQKMDDPGKEKLKGLQKMDENEKKKKEGIRKMDEPQKEEDDKMNAATVQTKHDTNTTASPQVSSKIQNAAGKGNTLPKKTLQEMNSSFGVDFSNVRVHNDSEAVDLNKELQAQAFTYGRDIYFNQAKYNPESIEGKFLLAHELTHVVQQGGANKSGVDETVQKSPAVAIAIGAAATAAILCAYTFYQYALDNFPEKNDKWKHCWVSCKIAAWCGGSAFSLIIGAGKEGIDAICDAYGKGCKAEFLDFVADLEGVACANVPLLSCTDCCDNATGYLQQQ